MTTTTPARPTVTGHHLVRVRTLPGLLETHDASGRHRVWHLAWLRHQCPADVHPVTGERLADPARIDVDAPVEHTEILDGGVGVVLTWADGHRSTYPADWLAASPHPVADIDLPPAGDVAALEVDASTTIPGEAAAQRLRDRGVVVLRGLGASTDDTDRLIAAAGTLGLTVRGSHFGRIQEVRADGTTDPNSDQLGYTDAAVDLHTDLPFAADPPRYQVLHAIRPADHGGDNAVADGLAVARLLRAIDRPAFDRLATTKVRLHRRQAAYEAVLDTPLVEVDDAGEPFRVRSSYFTLAALDLPFDELRSWWRAYRAFQRLLHDPAFRTDIRLGAGDALLYDNHRMLHARTAFTGPRWVRGFYLEEVTT